VKGQNAVVPHCPAYEGRNPEVRIIRVRVRVSKGLNSKRGRWDLDPELSPHSYPRWGEISTCYVLLIIRQR